MRLSDSCGVLLAAALLEAGAMGQAVLWQFQTSTPNDGTGATVQSLGDLDLDGVSEVLAGAPGSSPSGLQYAGGVRLLSGASGTPLFTADGTIPNTFFGWWVGAVGDMNADGLPDFAATDLYQAVLDLRSGADGSIFAQFSGERLVSPGDLSGDGLPDTVVGVPGATIPPLCCIGRVDAYSGTSTTVLYSVWGPSISASVFGARLGVIGDADGDGVADYAAGSRGGASSTIPYVALLSGATGNALFGWTGGVQSGFGEVIVGPGDVDGDGVPDVGVGAPLAPIWFEQGVFVVFSGSTGNPIRSWGGTAFYQDFGAASGRLGDLDGDGFADVLVSAPGTSSSSSGTFLGRVFVYSGATGQALVEIVEPSPPGRFGFSIDGAGDLNGDDFPDFLVGEPGYPPVPLIGSIYAYSGAPVGVQTYGRGCVGTMSETPRIGTTGSPARGSTFQVNLSRTVAGTPAFLVVGLSDMDWLGNPLPASLAAAGAPGCSLFASVDAVYPVVTSGPGPALGRASLPFTIPNDPLLAGGQVFVQWYVVDPGPLPAPGAMSRALRLTIQ